MDNVKSELCYKATTLQRNYRKISTLTFHVKHPKIYKKSLRNRFSLTDGHMKIYTLKIYIILQITTNTNLF